MQHLNTLPCRHFGISLHCFVKTDLFYSLCHAVSVFWTCISCRSKVCWLKLNTFQAHCDYHKNHTAKYIFNYFMLYSKAATFVSRQTRMYCLYRTVISIESFVQSVWVEHLWDYCKSYTFYFLWEWENNSILCSFLFRKDTSRFINNLL